MKEDSSFSDSFFAPWVMYLTGIVLLSLILFLFFFTWTRQVYSFDGFCYMFLGKSISVGSPRATNLFIVRAPLISLLFASIFLCLPFLSTSQVIGCIGFFCLFLTLIMLGLAYRLYRRAFSPALARVLVCLLLMNRLVLHYGSEPMTDILPAIWILASYSFYQKARANPSSKVYFLITGLLLGLTFASRQIGSLVAVGFFLFYVVSLFRDPLFRSKRKGLSLWWCLFCLSILPCAVGMFFYSWMFYFFTGRVNPLAFFLQFKLYPLSLSTFNHIYDKPYEYVLYLIKSGGWVVPFLIFWGLCHTFRHWKRDGALAVVCLFIFAYLSFGIIHREARYILPILPILYYFLGRLCLKRKPDGFASPGRSRVYRKALEKSPLPGYSPVGCLPKQQKILSRFRGWGRRDRFSFLCSQVKSFCFPTVKKAEDLHQYRKVQCFQE